VPSDDQLDAQQKTAAAVAQQNGQVGHSMGGDQAEQTQGGQRSGATNDMGPRVNISGGVH
jgi:hypothetical protein